MGVLWKNDLNVVVTCTHRTQQGGIFKVERTGVISGDWDIRFVNDAGYKLLKQGNIDGLKRTGNYVYGSVMNVNTSSLYSIVSSYYGTYTYLPMNYSETYYICAWNGDNYGSSPNVAFLGTYTVPPAKPTIQSFYSPEDNKLRIDCGKVVENVVSKYRVEIYNNFTNDLIFTRDITEPTTFKVPVGSYYVKAQSILTKKITVDEQEVEADIPCCMWVHQYNMIPDGANPLIQGGNYGTEYTQTYVTSAVVSVTGNSFNWMYSYMDRQGVPIIGTSKVINKNEEKYFYITANEWNDLCDYVYGFIWVDTDIGEYVYGYPATTTYGELVNAAKVTQNEPVSAKKFNMLRYCIGSHTSTQGTVIAKDFESNDDIRDEYFNTLKNYANKLITVKG